MEKLDHIPVLLNEVIEVLNPTNDKIYVDAFSKKQNIGKYGLFAWLSIDKNDAANKALSRLNASNPNTDYLFFMRLL